MHAAQTVKELYAVKKREIFDQIVIRRSMLAQGRIRPEGYIFYNITMFTTDCGKPQKYSGTRLIDLSKEAKMGMENIVENIKIELAAKYFNFSIDPELEETTEADGL